jgi:hypothetical protein
MVELASKKFVCIVDESKLVKGLGGSKGAKQAAPIGQSMHLSSRIFVPLCARSIQMHVSLLTAQLLIFACACLC